MNTRTLLKRATAAALMSATLATPAAVLTASPADARPREGSCRDIALAIDSAQYMANVHRDQGDAKGAREWMGIAARASANYQRYCVS